MTHYKDGVKAQPTVKAEQIRASVKLIYNTVHIDGYGIMILTYAAQTVEGLILYAVPCPNKDKALAVHDVVSATGDILVGCHSVSVDAATSYMRSCTTRVLRWHRLERPSRNLDIPNTLYQVLATSRSQALQILRSEFGGDPTWL
jgi:hypothetical protein